jgi:hypothetical protein
MSDEKVDDSRDEDPAGDAAGETKADAAPTDPDEAELHAAIARLLERNEVAASPGGTGDAPAEADTDPELAVDGEDLAGNAENESAELVDEASGPAVEAAQDVTEDGVIDAEVVEDPPDQDDGAPEASSPQLDEAIAVLPPASVPPPAGSHSPGRMDPRIETGAAPEPPKRTVPVVASPSRALADPRVSQQAEGERRKRQARLWILPMVLVAGVLGLVFVPDLREADRVETARLPDAPEIGRPVDDSAAMVDSEEPESGSAPPADASNDTRAAPADADPAGDVARDETAKPGVLTDEVGADASPSEQATGTPAPARSARAQQASPSVKPPRRDVRDARQPVGAPSATARARVSDPPTSTPASMAPAPTPKPTSLSRFGGAPAKVGDASPVTESAARSGPRQLVLPPRTYPGDIVPGSAADLAIRVAEFGGSPLAADGRERLALAVESALETELDGRVIALVAPDGGEMRVHFLFSQERFETVDMARAANVARLPEAAVIEGGWYAAETGAVLRPVPDIQTGFDDGGLRRGALLERLATITGVYGDRWYLVGRDGVGLGYVSAAEVTPAGAYDGPVTRPHPPASGRIVTEQAEAITRCRTIDIRMQGRAGETGTVCRNGDGRWLAQGPIRARPNLALGPGTASEQARLANRLVREARMTADRPPSVAAEGKFTQDFNRLLASMPDGTEVQTALPDGRTLRLAALNTRRETRRVTVQRAAEVGRLPAGLMLAPGWSEVRRSGAISPVPARQARLVAPEVPAGAAIESMASYRGAEGSEWRLIGRDGIAYGYFNGVDLVSIATPEPGLRFKAWRREHGRIVRDLVEADVRCRDLELSAPRLASRAVSVCQSPAGHWIVEDAGNALASVPGQVVFERLYR